MKKVLVVILVLIISLGGVFFFHTWQYRQTHQVLRESISNLQRTHQESMGKITGTEIDARISAIDSLIFEPKRLTDLERKVAIHNEASDYLRKLVVGEQLSLGWSEPIKKDLKSKRSSLEDFYRELVKMNIDQSLSDIQARRTVSQVVEVARVFANNNERISKSISGISAALTNTVIEEFKPDGTIRIAPFKDLKGELTQALDKFGRSAVEVANSENAERSGAIYSQKSFAGFNQQSKEYSAWLGQLQSLAQRAADYGIPSDQVLALHNVGRKGARDLRDASSWVAKSLEAQEKSNELLGKALRYADTANRMTENMGQFDSADDIFKVAVEWTKAKNTAHDAIEVLSLDAPRKINPLTNSILAPTRQTAEQIFRKLDAHYDMVDRKYVEAQRQESTWQGRAARTSARSISGFFNKSKQALQQAAGQAAKTRMGRELKLSAKMFILGTHAMYSMMEPDTDPISWAYSYSDDVDQLMRETDEVMRMEGPSITGKNTIIEDLVNSAYEASFD